VSGEPERGAVCSPIVRLANCMLDATARSRLCLLVCLVHSLDSFLVHCAQDAEEGKGHRKTHLTVRSLRVHVSVVNNLISLIKKKVSGRTSSGSCSNLTSRIGP
jgi:hypothetical protein